MEYIVINIIGYKGKKLLYEMTYRDYTRWTERMEERKKPDKVRKFVIGYEDKK